MFILNPTGLGYIELKVYPQPPVSIPDVEIAIEDICDGPGFYVPPPGSPLSVLGSAACQAAKQISNNILAPFLNVTLFRLMSWFYNGRQTKSIADLDELVDSVIQPDDFSKEHLKDFSAGKVLKEMDDFFDDTAPCPASDGWIEGSVKIRVPCTGVKQKEKDAPLYEIKGLFYRKPLEVIKNAFQSPSSKKFHYTPFKLYQQRPFNPSDTEPISDRLHSELYNSPAFIDEHNHVQEEQWAKQQEHPEDMSLKLPNALAGMMLWSDATRVGNWGDQSMWPIYLYFGNQSKYDRAKPSAHAAHHIAYIPKVYFSYSF